MEFEIVDLDVVEARNNDHSLTVEEIIVAINELDDDDDEAFEVIESPREAL